MTSLRTLGEKFAAAVSAFALSLVLISATVSMPASPAAQHGGVYVGAVA